MPKRRLGKRGVRGEKTSFSPLAPRSAVEPRLSAFDPVFPALPGRVSLGAGSAGRSSAFSLRVSGQQGPEAVGELP